MGFVRSVMQRFAPLATSVVAPEKPLSVRFDAIGQDHIPPEFFGLTSYADATAPAPRIDRRAAVQVPAVKRGRDLIAGQLGTLPVDLFGPDGLPVVRNGLAALLEQPEAGIPRSVTFARTFEDMLYEGVAWWLVTEIGWHGYPVKVKRLDPRTVSVKENGKVHITKMGHTGQSTDYEDDFDLIRFDSPNDPLLVAGARAIRTALALDSAAARYADGNQPLDYFSSVDDFDPDQEDVDEVLDGWEAARRAKSTGYVPAGFKYETAGWNPEQLQMADQRQHARLEIANTLGIDPEDLGIPTTTRTYQNAQDRYQARIKDTLRGYMVAFEERLSMNDVTPRGYRARMNTSDLLRTDDLTRIQVAEKGLTSKVMTEDEARSYFNPDLPVSTRETADV